MAKTIALNNVISEDVEEIEWEQLSMSDFYADDYIDIMSYSRPINIGWIDVSVLDLFNIPITNNDAIKDLLKKE